MISERFKNEIEELCAVKRTSLGENMKKKRRAMGLADPKPKKRKRTLAQQLSDSRSDEELMHGDGLPNADLPSMHG